MGRYGLQATTLRVCDLALRNFLESNHRRLGIGNESGESHCNVNDARVLFLTSNLILRRRRQT